MKMKNTERNKMKGKYILGTFWIIIAVLLCTILIKDISGRNFWKDGFSLKKIKLGNFVEMAEQKNFEEKKMTYEEILNGEMNELFADITSQGITVTGTRESFVKIQFFGHAEECFSWNLKNKTLSISSKNAGKKYYNPQVVIYVPEGKLDSVKLNVKSGSINVSDLDIKTLEAEAKSGAIKFSEINAQKAMLTASSGAVNCYDFECKNLTVQTSSGSARIEGKILQADVKTTSGAINFKNDSELKENSSFEATSGAVKLSLKPSSQYNFNCEGHLGSVKNALSSNADGNVKIDIKVSSGAIKVEQN